MIQLNRVGHDIAEPQFQLENRNLWKGAMRTTKGLRFYPTCKLTNCHSFMMLAEDMRQLGQRQKP